MSDDYMETHTRLSHAEWEIKALKEEQQRQGDRMTELSTRIDVYHKEVMAAVGGLRDEKARNEGAAEARMKMLRWLSFAVGAIGLMAALGWINSSEAAWLPVDVMTDPPIPVQYYAREVP